MKRIVEVMLLNGVWIQHTCDRYACNGGALVFYDLNDEVIIGYGPMGYQRFRPVREGVTQS